MKGEARFVLTDGDEGVLFSLNIHEDILLVVAIQILVDAINKANKRIAELEKGPVCTFGGE
jgi:hypothetical protein